MIADEEKSEKIVTFKEFLESIPPGRSLTITVSSVPFPMAMAVSPSYSSRAMPDRIEIPTVEIYCENCDGKRCFESTERIFPVDPKGIDHAFLTYSCRNCRRSSKVFAVRFWDYSKSESTISTFKYGESPAFGPPVPSRLLSLIGTDRDYFLKGRRSESQGLGIAAFSYYRRVIEDQKNRIIDEIIKVSKRLGASAELVTELERAKEETQFTKAVKQIKQGLPQTLLIDDTHNPLTLLHSALSAGLHKQTDEECLENATHIRVVMAELAERISAALKEDAELNKAVSKLLNRKKK